MTYHVSRTVNSEKGQAVLVADHFSAQLRAHVLGDQIGTEQRRLGRQHVQGGPGHVVEPRALAASVQFRESNSLHGGPGALVAHARVRIAVVDVRYLQPRNNVTIEGNHAGGALLRTRIAGVVLLGCKLESQEGEIAEVRSFALREEVMRKLSFTFTYCSRIRRPGRATRTWGHRPRARPPSRRAGSCTRTGRRPPWT
jgi:hypothetical protein